MPFKSEKQRRFMWSQHPEIARRWADEGKGYVEKKYGIKTSGTTISDNKAVGSAGQPKSDEAQDRKMMRKHEAKDEKRFGAIQRRMAKMKKGEL